MVFDKAKATEAGLTKLLGEDGGKTAADTL
jgi:hypothetical protein